MGYLAVGLTFTYALSGLAVNHITDWDPNFHHEDAVHELGGPIGGDEAAQTRSVLERLGISSTPKEAYALGEDELEILFDRKTLHVNTRTGTVREEGQSPRFLLRAANWLHLNRGKRAWTYVADTYAFGLLMLALSGLFMIPGRRGLVGRGGLLVALGVAIPIVYVTFSGVG
jgi:hypothetical protein